MNRLREKTTATILIAIFMISAFAVAMPALAVNVIHVYDTESIQAAIDVATPGTLIIVHAGTYSEDLDIPVTLTGLELSGASGAIIQGLANVHYTNWPLALPNIDIWADGVKVHGFTIEGPAHITDYYSSGMVIGGENVEIYDNVFKATGADTTDEISQAIQTYLVEDLSGLNIHDNTFTTLVTSTLGFEAIYVNRGTGSGTVTIADNIFTGEVFRAISTDRSNTVISGNSLDTTITDAWQGIMVRNYADAQDSVAVTGNTIEGFEQGILIGASSGTYSQTLTNIEVIGNTIQDNDVGVKVRSSPGGVTLSSNNILLGNDMGVENTDSAELDATMNWWGTTVDIHLYVNGNVVYEPYLTAAYSPSSTGLGVVVAVVVETVSITVTGAVDFGTLTPGTVDTSQLVNVENTGTVTVDVTATLIDEDPVDFYTDYLKMGSTPDFVVDWLLDDLADGADVNVDLQLSVPDPCAPGTKSATLVFWAEAS